MIKWRYASGGRITCDEKIKMLNENLQEIDQILKDALDDAVLIGMDELEFKRILKDFIDSLNSEY